MAAPGRLRAKHTLKRSWSITHRAADSSSLQRSAARRKRQIFLAKSRNTPATGRRTPGSFFSLDCLRTKRIFLLLPTTLAVGAWPHHTLTGCFPTSRRVRSSNFTKPALIYAHRQNENARRRLGLYGLVSGGSGPLPAEPSGRRREPPLVVRRPAPFGGHSVLRAPLRPLTLLRMSPP